VGFEEEPRSSLVQIAPANVKDEEKAIPQVDENQLKLEEEQRKVLASSQFSCYWDERCGFPPTPPEDLIHWSRFNSNIYSDEMSAKAALAAIEGHDEEWIDLRPYMIEQPQKLSRYATVAKALDIFRTYHLRHLLVVDPEDDSLSGILTRKDLDTVMTYDHDVEMRRF